MVYVLLVEKRLQGIDKTPFVTVLLLVDYKSQSFGVFFYLFKLKTFTHHPIRH